MRHTIQNLEVAIKADTARTIFVDVVTDEKTFWLELYSASGKLLKKGNNTDELLKGRNVEYILPVK